MNVLTCHKLLITVVQKGKAKKIIDATREAGAEGGTIFLGKGTGIVEKKFLGVPVTEEKEIILTLFDQAIIDSSLPSSDGGREAAGKRAGDSDDHRCRQSGRHCPFMSAQREKNEVEYAGTVRL
jgi:hypothetical protein